jgi:hypothetical protein
VLLLGLSLLLGAALAVYISEEFAEDTVAFLLPYQFAVWTGLLLPGALLYLVLLGSLRPASSGLAQRARAIALSPLLAIVPALMSFVADSFFGSYFWVFLAPAVFLYGGAVRLPPPVRRDPAS